MNISRTIAVVATTLISVAGCQPAAVDTSADEAAIRASAPAWAAAFNASNAEAIANMYWEDAVLQPPGAPAAVGRDAIRAFMTADIAGAKAAGLTMVIPEAGAVRVSGELAYEAGNYSVTDESGATVDVGKYLGVFERRNGKWLYIRDTWNSDNAPQAPMASEAAAVNAEATEAAAK